MLKKRFLRILAVLPGLLLLAGCVAQPERAAVANEGSVPASTVAVPAEAARPSDAERLLAEKHRQCQEEKRRLDNALKENQKRNDELQKKLDGLLAIDRDLRSRGKAR
jgi:hypothetical protein